MGEEARQRVLLHRLDFTAEARQRLATNLAQDLGVAPLAVRSARTEGAFEDASFHGQLV